MTHRSHPRVTIAILPLSVSRLLSRSKRLLALAVTFPRRDESELCRAMTTLAMSRGDSPMPFAKGISVRPLDSNDKMSKADKCFLVAHKSWSRGFIAGSCCERKTTDFRSSKLPPLCFLYSGVSWGLSHGVFSSPFPKDCTCPTIHRNLGTRPSDFTLPPNRTSGTE